MSGKKRIKILTVSFQRVLAGFLLSVQVVCEISWLTGGGSFCFFIEEYYTGTLE